MVWKKSSTNHVPDWVPVRLLGWYESIRELLLLLAAGAAFGVLAVLLVCWHKSDDWRHKNAAVERLYNLIK